MSEQTNSERKNFRDCSIFTAERSLSSIISVCDFETTSNTQLRILDAFAGEGLVADAIAEELKRRGNDYSIAIAEISQNHIKNASDDYTKLCLDILRDPIGGKYDLIVIRYGLHDLGYEDKVKSLGNLVSALEKNGRIIISDLMPSENSGKWLEMIHQQKEILTKGPNRNICLSAPEDYIRILKDNGVQAEINDSFYQEVFMREWVGTYGATEEAVSALEKLTLRAPQKSREQFLVFNHPKIGARTYFPIVTIAGVKNE